MQDQSAEHHPLTNVDSRLALLDAQQIDNSKEASQSNGTVDKKNESQASEENEEGGEDEMTEPVGDGEEMVEFASDKDELMRGGEDVKLVRKGSIQSPVKGQANGESSADVAGLKLSYKESLKERASKTRQASTKLSGAVGALKRKTSNHQN